MRRRVETFPEFLRAPGDPRSGRGGAGAGCSWVREERWVGTRGASPIQEGLGPRVKTRAAAPGGLLHRCLRGRDDTGDRAAHLSGSRAGLLWPQSEPGRVLLRRGVGVGPGGTRPSGWVRRELPHYLMFRRNMKRAARRRALLHPHPERAFAPTREASCSWGDLPRAA